MTTKRLLLLTLLLMAVVIGYFMFRFLQVDQTIPLVTEDGFQVEVGTEMEEDVPVTATEEKSEKTIESISPPENGTKIETSSLTDGQRNLLGTLGIDADEITITPEMIACAEAKVGTARLKEIQNGDTPSFFEGIDLIACYRK